MISETIRAMLADGVYYRVDDLESLLEGDHGEDCDAVAEKLKAYVAEVEGLCPDAVEHDGPHFDAYLYGALRDADGVLNEYNDSLKDG